ncbi:MAG: hypothetical protein LBL30_02265 [Holosporales bacterium]|jgi:hypothetical protein|nr:hypothetical protein [Holosporales bacterium]
MNKKLLLSATALALVSSVLDNYAMAMRRPAAPTAEDSYISELRQKLERHVSDFEITEESKLPSNAQELVDEYALRFGGDINRINEVHEQLSLEGKKGHALMFSALQGWRENPLLKDISMHDIMMVYPELQKHYLIPPEINTPSLHNQVSSVASMAPIYNAFSPTLPANIRYSLVEATNGSIPLEEIRKAIPGYTGITEGPDNKLSKEDREKYIVYVLTQHGMIERYAWDMARHAIEEANKVRDMDSAIAEMFRSTR